MLLVAVLGTVLYDYVAVNQAARAGHDETFRWRPIVLAVDVAVTTTLYALTYLFGYAVGKWWRNRKGPD